MRREHNHSHVLMIKTRHVGGLDCFEVLARLSDYLDGYLPVTERDKVIAHVSGCQACERFGGSFAEAIRELRLNLGKPNDVPAEVTARLRRRLAED